MAPTATNSGTFNDLGIAPRLLEILAKLKFVTPTPIQHQSIPAAVQGKDIMGIAQTGTGKTLAFGIPMIQRIAQSQGKSKGLVVLPTRELALQVNETLKKIGGNLGLKTAILIGGESMQRQIRSLTAQPHIIIATPGRLIDHIESGRLKLTTTHVLVLDEADRMLDMGFAPQIKKILANVPKERQTMLFSATMPDAIVNIAKSYMELPLRVEVARAGTAGENVEQELFFVPKDGKLALLKNLLTEYTGSVLVFSRTKFGAKKIAKSIRAFGHTADEIHSNRSLNQRIEALNGFKIGRYRILVATDIAARGIDVTGIQLVINYDLPENAEDYVHRIGRTGRAGMAGKAISFATPDQKRDVRDIERLIRMVLPVAKTPVLAHVASQEYIPGGSDDYRGARPDRRPAYRGGSRAASQPTPRSSGYSTFSFNNQAPSKSSDMRSAKRPSKPFWQKNRSSTPRPPFRSGGPRRSQPSR